MVLMRDVGDVTYTSMAGHKVESAADVLSSKIGTSV